MGRYTGPVGKVSRRLGIGISPKGERILQKRPFPPGQHGRSERPKKQSEYGLQLIEKQKVRFLYGLQERQFRNLFREVERRPGITGEALLVLLERRLDNVVFRMGLAKSRAQARQIVNHRHIAVNGRMLDIASVRVRVGDVISVREGSRRSALFQQIAANGNLLRHRGPNWLQFNPIEMQAAVVALPTRADAEPQVHEQSVVEFYSR
jgi:small subunit ribosomal protein S4